MADVFTGPRDTQYVKLREIGSGSYGKAILVKDGEGAQFVLKTIETFGMDGKELQDAVNEVRVLSSLRHPFIVSYQESFLDGDVLCIVMEYADGGDLHSRISKTRKAGGVFSEQQVVRWFAQAGMAIKYIHERHIIHRDLKSQNMFLTLQGKLCLGDFGIAKALDSTCAFTQTAIGTPFYLSPEICREKPYTFSSDIWALGVVLHEMATLRLPFDAGNLRALAMKIMHTPTPLIARHSPELQRLCADMLHKDSEKRPSISMILRRHVVQAEIQRMLLEERAVSRGEHPMPRRRNSSASPALPVSPPAALIPVAWEDVAARGAPKKPGNSGIVDVALRREPRRRLRSGSPAVRVTPVSTASPVEDAAVYSNSNVPDDTPVVDAAVRPDPRRRLRSGSPAVPPLPAFAVEDAAADVGSQMPAETVIADVVDRPDPRRRLKSGSPAVRVTPASPASHGEDAAAHVSPNLPNDTAVASAALRPDPRRLLRSRSPSVSASPTFVVEDAAATLIADVVDRPNSRVRSGSRAVPALPVFPVEDTVADVRSHLPTDTASADVVDRPDPRRRLKSRSPAVRVTPASPVPSVEDPAGHASTSVPAETSDAGAADRRELPRQLSSASPALRVSPASPGSLVSMEDRVPRTPLPMPRERLAVKEAGRSKSRGRMRSASPALQMSPRSPTSLVSPASLEDVAVRAASNGTNESAEEDVAGMAREPVRHASASSVHKTREQPRSADRRERISAQARLPSLDVAPPLSKPMLRSFSSPNFPAPRTTEHSKRRDDSEEGARSPGAQQEEGRHAWCQRPSSQGRSERNPSPAKPPLPALLLRPASKGSAAALGAFHGDKACDPLQVHQTRVGPRVVSRSRSSASLAGKSRVENSFLEQFASASQQENEESSHKVLPPLIVPNVPGRHVRRSHSSGGCLQSASQRRGAMRRVNSLCGRWQ